MRNLERSCLLRDPGCLNAAMLLPAAAVTEANAQFVWFGDFARDPELCARGEH